MQGKSLPGVSFTCVLQSADVVAPTPVATKSPSPPTTQKSAMSPRRRELVRCGMNSPLPSDGLCGAATGPYPARQKSNSCQRISRRACERDAEGRAQHPAVLVERAATPSGLDVGGSHGCQLRQCGLD